MCVSVYDVHEKATIYYVLTNQKSFVPDDEDDDVDDVYDDDEDDDSRK